MNYRLSKNERLHAEKLIKELFNEGSSFFLYPFKVLFLKKEDLIGQPNQVLFSVSKKKIKKATGRNFIKRRLKEAYRLNKQILPPDGIILGLIFVGKAEMSFAEIQPKMVQVLNRLNQELSQTPFSS
ncbi:MAG: ribonuclease P protein component [Algoriphagus sp.]|jgi:ribonuclease P protein component|uniref:ribonuclease P protein component n=1 Tax=Algoriphagus sp. TaxID=1872435 RepID=UPI001EB79386|nr:ribonuclease P protein component [Algoriphagus sp.]MBA4301908.1 ribonuclease P protein component [Cyclobacterium sp.]MDO8968211.1 ribonuclease P protein component [Algoriphagus sp.]MDP2040919.1 ribonuclease P protein component [Algoriphagus sp.]MDP3201024.1 ribonuclease P protein component [Algoriphagus sp.]MDP3470800.1 ribonuclease P protein component [Algoriphagus sp.]